MIIKHNPRKIKKAIPKKEESIKEVLVEEVLPAETDVSQESVEEAKEIKLIYSEEENKFILVEEE